MVQPRKKQEDESIRPFEWLTSASSLQPFLCKALHLSSSTGDAPSSTDDQPRSKRAVHVGCGSSVLGEHLLNDPIYRVCHVLNVDKDKETLDLMKLRWQRSQEEVPLSTRGTDEEASDAQLQFQCVDFCNDSIDADPESYDLVVDKSTLDCTLCSDRTTASLLAEIYRLLRPDGGVYLLVSFHDKALLQPLLQGLPGADWSVEHYVMPREVENLSANNDKSAKHDTRDWAGEDRVEAVVDKLEGSSAWSSGSFHPDEQYRRTVNVFLCRKKRTCEDETCPCILDGDAVYEHVNATSNQWYKNESPMLTSQRKSFMQEAFAGKHLCLKKAYNLMFTDAEREHLAYDYFVEDWQAFVASRPSLPRDKLSFETAVTFIDEMQ